MKTLLLILIRPAASARILRDRPLWVLPFCLLAMLHMGLLAAGDPLRVDAVLAHLPPSAVSADRKEVASMFAGDLPVRVLFRPVRLFLGWGTFAGLLSLFARAFSPAEPVQFRRLFALEVHAEAILFIGAALALLPFPVCVLIRSWNLCTLWYVAVLVTGIRVLCGFRIHIAAFIAAGAWVFTILFTLGIITLLANALHLRV
jgi:Yip1 domain.